MKYLMITLIAAAVFLSEGCISVSEVSVKDKNTFPTVTGTNLHGDEKTLPDCLEKEYTILIVAFERWQQELCDGWYVHIEKYMKENENTAYFEVPTISKMNGFMRWFIYRGMRGGITDEQMRRQVITLHIDKEPFKQGLNIDSEKTVYVYAVNKQGRLLALESGEYSAEKWQRLTAPLKEQK